MTNQEIQIIKQALAILHRLVPDDEPRDVDLTPRRCPVQAFAKRYLARDPGSDMSCAELWQFYAEVAAAGEAEKLKQAEFYRALPAAMASVFGVRKSHAINRDGTNVRGFRGIAVREQAEPEHFIGRKPS